MTQPAYTSADIDLVARALWPRGDVLGDPPAEVRHADARAVLTALATAGRLLPAATASEWGVRFLDSKTRQPHSKVYEAVTERQARAFAVSHCHVGEVGEVLTRKVTPWIAAEEPA